jgi:hypothetical protein
MDAVIRTDVERAPAERLRLSPSNNEAFSLPHKRFWRNVASGLGNRLARIVLHVAPDEASSQRQVNVAILFVGFMVEGQKT